MQIHQLKDLLKDFDKNVIYDQDLKKKNWFNIGGKSKVFFKPQSLKDLVEFLKIINNQESLILNVYISKNFITLSCKHKINQII